ncbi:MAG: Mpo1-like protein [Candidatus Acidiferrales bacterium]
MGHFFVEHNKPATFGHPGWSWLADQKMVGMMLLGRMGDEVRRAASSGGAGA